MHLSQNFFFFSLRLRSFGVQIRTTRCTSGKVVVDTNQWTVACSNKASTTKTHSFPSQPIKNKTTRCGGISINYLIPNSITHFLCPVTTGHMKLDKALSIGQCLLHFYKKFKRNIPQHSHKEQKLLKYYIYPMFQPFNQVFFLFDV